MIIGIVKSITPTQLRQNLYKLLDEVLDTGIPLEINRGGKRLRITPVEKVDKLEKLKKRPDIIVGNPNDLVDINWEGEVSLDLP